MTKIAETKRIVTTNNLLNNQSLPRFHSDFIQMSPLIYLHPLPLCDKQARN
jgi:hypothetical protein